ncbi:FAD/NAD(P)-binding domain-containing protein [Calocera cornea HHB12733]|uniref:FAD/NAD(P)-binding domain-containing protein n=1 Tax=Calocera cornea HHB12733 TaxID=1353952 RepID=A0A165C8N6_9BASI|nr:FAD/NAD(P)-binding domain-containing protein [Calocera cornea HHB12733]
MADIPKHAQILVVGGGPGGSYAATVLAREGFDVVLLESAKFPRLISDASRYHIGESMIPSMRFFLGLIDLEETVSKHGFLIKPGAAFKLVPDRTEGYSNFTALLGKAGTSWNFKRAEFDEILLRNAEKCGAKVFEQVGVSSLDFQDADTAKRPLAAHWKHTPSGSSGQITFDYLIDASGRTGLMSTKYLKNRRFNASLNNVACWGYWKGTGRYMPGTERDNAPLFEALHDESGWGWFIPLHDGTTSVGIVEDQAASVRKKREAKEAPGGAEEGLKEHYLRQLKLCPGVRELIGEGVLVEGGEAPTVRAASDFSYTATSYAGDHYRLVGDAAAFIDPFFSSGVHLAFTNALSAAVSIASSIRGDVPEKDCAAFHDAKVSLAYTKFLVIVLSAYTQMRHQNAAILSEINESDFQRAFEIINPVIQGRAETPTRLTPNEVKKAMDFCFPLIGLGPHMPQNGPPSPEFIAKMAPFRKWLPSLSDFNYDVINGFNVNLEKGQLGMVPVKEGESK